MKHTRSADGSESNEDFESRGAKLGVAVNQPSLSMVLNSEFSLPSCCRVGGNKQEHGLKAVDAGSRRRNTRAVGTSFLMYFINRTVQLYRSLLTTEYHYC